MTNSFDQMISFRLLSHRLRGFGAIESSLEALNNALELGVKHIELDVRLTRDRRFLVYHDPFFFDEQGTPQYIKQFTVDDLSSIPSLSSLPLLDQMLENFAARAASDVLIHIDVKAIGAEAELVAIIKKYTLTDRVVVVSWLPTVLKNVARICGDIKLCFSHITFTTIPLLWPIARKLFKNNTIKICGQLVAKLSPYYGELIGTLRIHFEDKDAELRFETDQVGFNHGHFVRHLISPDLLELLGGGPHFVCIPKLLATRSLIEEYHKYSIRVAVFSVGSRKQLREVLNGPNPDVIYVDNADLFVQ